jgi:hypothetical protein
MNRFQEYLSEMKASIAKNGRVIQAVGPDGEIPQFHYSIGLWPVAGFELVVFGMGFREGCLVLLDLSDRVLQGTRFTNGQVLTDVLANGYDVAMVEVADASTQLTIASLLHGPEATPLPAWQVALPDADHRMPWDLNYSGPIQPLLGPSPQ